MFRTVRAHGLGVHRPTTMLSESSTLGPSDGRVTYDCTSKFLLPAQFSVLRIGGIPCLRPRTSLVSSLQEASQVAKEAG